MCDTLDIRYVFDLFRLKRSPGRRRHLTLLCHARKADDDAERAQQKILRDRSLSANVASGDKGAKGVLGVVDESRINIDDAQRWAAS